MFVSAAIHGDELNGIEIGRLIRSKAIERLREPYRGAYG